MKNNVLIILVAVVAVCLITAGTIVNNNALEQSDVPGKDIIEGEDQVNKESYKAKKITSEKAKEMMDAGGVIVLDVRTADEFAQGYIENAVLLPDTEIGKKAEEVLEDKSATILVYCRSGSRSAAASKKLAKMGYSNIYDFGGIIDWPYETVK